MQTIKESIMYFLGFKSYVVLPFIIFILAVVFRIKLSTAIKSSLTIGIGFVGLFMTFDYFVTIINPVIQALIEKTGLHFNVLDTGWPPLAAITWSFHLAPLLMIVFLVVNILMLVLRLTKTVDIDIWNYWHIILGAAMVYYATNSALITILISTATFILVLKLAEWCAPMVNKFSGMKGICIPHLASLGYFPFALLANKIIDKIPVLNKIDAKPERIQKKIGIFGEPMILGLLMGIGLGIGGGYDIKHISELSVSFAAVIYILPVMCNILGSSLIPISEGMKVFINKQFPSMGETFIGLDVAVIFGQPSVIVSALLLIPVSLILAFILPGVNFIPLGDLTNLMVPVALVCVATRGNLVRSFLIGIPIVIVNLYVASGFASFFTKMAASANYHIANYNGTFTSYLDGGNFFRAWMVKLSEGDLVSLLIIPLALALLFFTWKETKKEI